MDSHDPSIAFFPDTCIIPKAGTPDKCGYFVLRVYRGDQNEKAHRVSYRMFKGNIPIGMVVMHTCDNPACINPKHLFLGTDADQNWKRAKHYFGEQIHNAKLTDDIVRIIRESDMTNKSLAEKFGVAESCIAKARTGITWKHVKAVKENGNG